MAGDAAVGFEELIPALLIGRNRSLRAAQIIIEWSIGCYQGALESGERVEHRRSLRRAGVNRSESRLIVSNDTHFRQQFLPTRVHQPRIQEDSLVLLFKRTEIPSPVKSAVERGVEDGQCIEIEFPTV